LNISVFELVENKFKGLSCQGIFLGAVKILNTDDFP
jgi:hypothetical protein